MAIVYQGQDLPGLAPYIQQQCSFHAQSRCGWLAKLPFTNTDYATWFNLTTIFQPK